MPAIAQPVFDEPSADCAGACKLLFVATGQVPATVEKRLHEFKVPGGGPAIAGLGPTVHPRRRIRQLYAITDWACSWSPATHCTLVTTDAQGVRRLGVVSELAHIACAPDLAVHDSCDRSADPMPATRIPNAVEHASGA